MTKIDIPLLAHVFNKYHLINYIENNNITGEPTASFYYYLLAILIQTLKKNDPKFDADKFINLLDKPC